MNYGYVYLITDNKNGKTYVGQRKLPTGIVSYSEDRYMGSGKLLKKAQQEYGMQSFEKFLIQYCSSKEELDKQSRISKLNSTIFSNRKV